MKKSKLLLLILLIGVAVIAAIPFLKEVEEENKRNENQKAVEKEIENTIKDGKSKRGRVKKLKVKNKDVIAYLEIPGTSISYPVMQTKDNPDYYLNHDINKNYSSYGTPYLSAYCDIMSADQLIIYGHNMGRGRMFGALTNYRDVSYMEKYKTIFLDTKKRKIKFEIFAVMSVNIHECDYWQFVMARDEADFNRYVDMVTANSIHTQGVKPKYGEQILALSTCDNGRGNDWRFVVLGRKV